MMIYLVLPSWADPGKKRIIKIDQIIVEKMKSKAGESRTRESWKRTILFARMTKTIRRTTENIIMINSGQWQVNLVLPVTPWHPPFLISHQR